MDATAHDDRRGVSHTDGTHVNVTLEQQVYERHVETVRTWHRQHWWRAWGCRTRRSYPPVWLMIAARTGATNETVIDEQWLCAGLARAGGG